MRFQFTIRDIFWLILSVALLTGWLLDRYSYRTQWLASQLEIERLGQRLKNAEAAVDQFEAMDLDRINRSLELKRRNFIGPFTIPSD
jgi:hypothetical protein